MSRPFIVTVASEKGGVGKTTIATNLAVYIKALREDLSATIASFDNHFSVDQMFAIHSHSASSVADLLRDAPGPELAALGEYGVQFIRSERRLETPEGPPKKLAGRLRQLDLDGILVLDTRPILDWFTEGALLAADLVLVPIKDRASLVNVAAIKALLEARGAEQCLWLVPSLVDARARLNAEIRVKDLLVFSARERDYQVVDMFISKSPKVESLASGFSSRVHPVLTHARQTAVHRQLRQLADFVITRYDDRVSTADSHLPAAERIGRLRHLVGDCPLCCNGMPETGHFFFDVRSRRCGFLHPACLETFAAKLESPLPLESEGGLLLRMEGAGMVDSKADAVCYLVDAAGEVTATEAVDLSDRQLRDGLAGMTGREVTAWQREVLLVEMQPRSLDDFSDDTSWAGWKSRRRRLLAALRQV